MTHFFRITFFLISVCISVQLKANHIIRVGLLQGKSVYTLQIEVLEGSVQIINGSQSTALDSANTIAIDMAEGQVRFRWGKEERTGSKLKIAGNHNTLMTIAPPAGNKSYRYNHILEFSIYNGALLVINELPLESYIPGVVEAEGGPNHPLEYYKAQALVSRTYVTNQFHKHEGQGFNVCDQTHCQVYHGTPKHKFIMEAAAIATEDLVVVDDNANLITAAFHSNCGGKTNSAENVWARPLPYCQSVIDTFCMKMPNSNWEKRIAVEDWSRYLSSKRLESSDSAHYGYFPKEKEVYFREGETRVSLVTMRKDLKLKSTYFSVYQDGEDMVLVGQGFGHGVGMCQEGAMRMAELGYTYTDIIHFYFHNVRIVPLQYIAFFKEE